MGEAGCRITSRELHTTPEQQLQFRLMLRVMGLGTCIAQQQSFNQNGGYHTQGSGVPTCLEAKGCQLATRRLNFRHVWTKRVLDFSLFVVHVCTSFMAGQSRPTQYHCGLQANRWMIVSHPRAFLDCCNLMQYRFLLY